MNKKIKIAIILALALTSIALLNVGSTVARFVSSSVWNYYVTTQGLYISSDKLNEKNKENYSTNWNGETITFNLENISKEKIAEYDISYDLECEVLNKDTDITCEFIKGNKGKIIAYATCVNDINDHDVSKYDKAKCEIEGYKWVSKKSTNEVTVKINPNGTILTENDEIEVNIKANITAPYKKTLSGNFKLYKANYKADITSNLNSYENYSQLTITNTTNEDQCVKINWDGSKIIIDAKPEEFQEINVNAEDNINEIIFKIKKNENNNYIFYRIGNNKIEEKDFIIKKNETCSK